MSNNNGETWTDISSGLCNTDIHAVTVADDGNVYCGTWGDGVYRLLDIDLAVPLISSATGFWLSQNFPNPFNPTTLIRYQLPVGSNAKLIVYDILGREVSVLVNERREAGVHQVMFDASGLSSGVYFYRIQSGSFVQTRKLLLLH